MKVLFVHEGLGQFEVLHNYLNANGMAESWFLVSRGAYNAHKEKVQNLLPFDMPPENEKSYFYTRHLEARIQRSFLIRKAILDLLGKVKIDVIVAHGSGGFPLQYFNEFEIPIITYIEFPSFTAHGYDEKYPQPEYATYRDRVFEMTSFHQALVSDLTLVPSMYAKSMFPSCLHERIVAQMEGFDIKRKPSQFAKEDGFTYIGFTARDLSSAKGFEQYVLIAKEILKLRSNVKFVFCGDPKTLYSYEAEFLQKNFAAESRPESFMEYVLHREGFDLSDTSPFRHVKFSAYEDYADYVEAMDFFLYPLQYGSANWGLFELLFRGRVVVASDRCFVPEIVKHNYNGLLCKYDDMDTWVRYAVDIVDHPEKYRRIGECAEKDANERFHIRKVAESYLKLFDMAVARRKLLSDSCRRHVGIGRN